MSDFPFTVKCPYNLIHLFRKHDSLSWYECDMRVVSFDEVVFRVYGMRDACWGGRGDHERDVPVKNVDRDILLPVIECHIARCAEQRYIDAEERRVRALIAKNAARDLQRELTAFEKATRA